MRTVIAVALIAVHAGCATPADISLADIHREFAGRHEAGWRFDPGEPREIQIVTNRVHGDHATLVIAVRVADGNARMAGEMELLYGRLNGRWLLLTVRNVSFKTVDAHADPQPVVSEVQKAADEELRLRDAAQRDAELEAAQEGVKKSREIPGLSAWQETVTTFPTDAQACVPAYFSGQVFVRVRPDGSVATAVVRPRGEIGSCIERVLMRARVTAPPGGVEAWATQGIQLTR